MDTFEKWESEFLQMAAYVLLMIWLIQKGFSGSMSLGDPEGCRPQIKVRSGGESG